MGKMTFIMALLLPQLVSATGVFAGNEHCVAWKTKKTIALFKKVYPLGKNCSITTKMIKVNEEDFRFEGVFPLNKFNSDDEDRDLEVVKILGGEKQSNLNFQTMAMSLTQWKKILKAGSGEVKGYLKIAGVEYVLRLTISVNKTAGATIFSGQLISDYKTFGIEPPQVAGGLVAKAANYLELHFQFQAKEIEGIEAVLQ